MAPVERNSQNNNPLGSVSTNLNDTALACSRFSLDSIRKHLPWAMLQLLMIPGPHWLAFARLELLLPVLGCVLCSHGSWGMTRGTGGVRASHLQMSRGHDEGGINWAELGISQATTGATCLLLHRLFWGTGFLLPGWKLGPEKLSSLGNLCCKLQKCWNLLPPLMASLWPGLISCHFLPRVAVVSWLWSLALASGPSFFLTLGQQHLSRQSLYCYVLWCGPGVTHCVLSLEGPCGLSKHIQEQLSKRAPVRETGAAAGSLWARQCALHVFSQVPLNTSPMKKYYMQTHFSGGETEGQKSSALCL